MLIEATNIINSNMVSPRGVLYESDIVDNLKVPSMEPEKIDDKPKYKMQIVWRTVFTLGYIHLAALYGVVLMLTSANLMTTLWAFLLYEASVLGVTAGSHRLWSHRAYKAKWQLKLLLIILNTLAFQNSVHEFVRDHRLHHKYSDTDADPHNTKRGFFFAHVGWTTVRKHPEVSEKGKGVDLSDIYADPFVMLQKKYMYLVVPPICFLLPSLVPVYFWGETWWNAWHIATMFRYALGLNATFLVNSAAHRWGMKSYDKFITPVDNYIVSTITNGEGWHNYHHVFPWDYKTAELGNFRINLTTELINLFSHIGWAYDMKSAPNSMIQKRMARTGDGTKSVWGWGDKDMEREDILQATIYNKK